MADRAAQLATAERTKAWFALDVWREQTGSASAGSILTGSMTWFAGIWAGGWGTRVERAFVEILDCRSNRHGSDCKRGPRRGACSPADLHWHHSDIHGGSTRFL